MSTNRKSEDGVIPGLMGSTMTPGNEADIDSWSTAMRHHADDALELALVSRRLIRRHGTNWYESGYVMSLRADGPGDAVGPPLPVGGLEKGGLEKQDDYVVLEAYNEAEDSNFHYCSYFSSCMQSRPPVLVMVSTLSPWSICVGQVVPCAPSPTQRSNPPRL